MEREGSMGVHSIWCLGNRRREMRNLTVRPWSRTAALALFAAGAAVPLQAPAAWEPTKTVEFVVPAGTGGGADPMARGGPGIIAEKKLLKKPIGVVHQEGGAGAGGIVSGNEAESETATSIVHPS